MEIRLGTLADLPTINLLYKKVMADIHKTGSKMWNDIYPFCEFQTDLEKEEMYVLTQNEQIIGGFAINLSEDPHYTDVSWTDSTFCYLNRLAIDPDYQRMGLAKEVLNFLEQFAVEHQIDTIRLTILPDNQKAEALYTSSGYIEIPGEITCENVTLVGYELDVSRRCVR